MGRFGSTVGMVLAVLAVATSSAVAKPGVLDPTFGESGRAATALDLGPSWEDAMIEMATGPDSSIVVSSERQLVRYLSDGQLDRGFGDNGILTLEQVEGLPFDLDDVAVDSEGRVVAFGTAVDSSKTFRIPSYSGGYEHPTYAVILRFDAAGRLDPSFGGTGIVRTDFGLPMNRAEDGSSPSLIRTVAGIVDSQDRPMLVAAQFEHIATEGHSRLGWVNRVAARLTSGGQPDPNFGAGNGVTVLPSSGYEGMAAAPAGEPLLLWGGAQSISWVARLRGNGAPEDAYGSAGVRRVRGGGGDFVLDRFGRLLILERPGGKAVRVLRLRPDGSLDPSFSRGGRATVALPVRGGAISSIAVDARGRTAIVGASSRARVGGGSTATALIIATRLQASGKLDRAFGGGGWTRVGFGHRTQVAGAHEVFALNRWRIAGPQVVLDPRGRLVIADAAHSPQLQPGGVVLARYRMN